MHHVLLELQYKFSSKFLWKTAILNILSDCSMSKFKNKVKEFITMHSIFCQLSGIYRVKELNHYLLTFPYSFILHGKEWREPVSCWVLSLCSECICKVLCWWLSWAGLQIGRNSVSTDATIVEESSACYQGLKYGSLLLKCWMHVCIHANMPKFRFARLDVCLKHILCGLGLAQSVSGIRHPCQITLRVKRYSDWFLCIL